MDDYDIRSAASILASVKEQEARFERLTRALEEERRNVSLQLERANQPADRMSICNIGNGQPLATAWQQLVLQVTACSSHCHCSPPLAQCPIPESRCIVCCQHFISACLCLLMAQPRGAVCVCFITHWELSPLSLGLELALPLSSWDTSKSMCILE